MVDEQLPGHGRVVLATAAGPMRDALRLLLGIEPDLDLVAEADSFEAAVRQARRHTGAVVVLNLALVRGGVLEAIRWATRAAPWSRVVALSMDDGEAFARRAIAAGACAYVVADHAEADLATAIRHAGGHDRAHAPW